MGLEENTIIPAERIESCILYIRGHKVMLDAHLAGLYGVDTRTLVQAVKRNIDRFPADFMFQLTRDEHQILRSQNVISKKRMKDQQDSSSEAKYRADEARGEEITRGDDR